MKNKGDPLIVERYISLMTKNELDKDDIGAWYHCVVNHAPVGITRTINVVDKKGKPEAVALVHRVCGEKEVHCYLVPLTRDLSHEEVDKIVKSFAEKRPKLDFDIETQATSLNAKDHSGISMDHSKHIALCSALEKQKHEDWVRERTDGGWRYGTTFDADEKTHPLILPWDQLPDRYKEPNLDWPNKLISILNDQGYAIIDKDELEKLLALLRGII